MHAFRRRLGALLAGVMAVTASVTIFGSTDTAHAGGNSLYFSNGSDNISVGANAAIYIDGTITFDANCQGGTRPGIDDFVYPATDVYIVNAGSATDGSGLTDAGGNGPNTIVGTGSGAFIGELIAVVYPSGSLGDGTYDVVYDTCQDGVVDFEDEIWYDAITVDVPDGEIPPPNDSIKRIKDAAREEYAAWLKTHMGLTALFKFEDALAIAACILAPTPGCLIDVLTMIYDVDGVMAQSSNWIEDSSLKLVMNRAKNYGAIWQDPADPAFDQLPTVTPEDVRPVALSGEPVADALAAVRDPLAGEGALADALLHALERYQGAEAAGDEQWALTQARAVADLSGALADHLRTSTAVVDLRDAIAADIDNVVARGQQGAAVINRVRTTGFTAEERRQLMNRGIDAAGITALERRFVADGRQVAPGPEQVMATFDELVAARTEMAAALDESVAGWTTLAGELAARVDAPLPVADAGGAYTSTGGSVALDASASTTPAGTTITAYEWDLDGDGQYGDAAGATPVVQIPQSRTVGVRVTNDAGHAAVGFAVVEVGSAAPAAATATPANRAVVTTAGVSTQFSFIVPGTGADAWTLDGQPVAEGQSFTYTTDGDDVGVHVVSATATRGLHSYAQSWIVSVMAVDADADGWTATPDCNDSRADVHPGGFERLGNGLDDDCDPRTPDEPVGGVTGELWGWGYYLGVGRGPGADVPSPVRVTSVGNQVRAVESTHTGGYAVLADGTVRAWGPGYTGQLGNGSTTTSSTPVVVQNVGGGGALSGVTSVASDDGTVLALRQDGSVVGWGSNLNQQIGDDTDVDYKLFPTPVLDADTGQPLTGAAQVEYGENSSYAVMQDGTVKVWGVNRCNGTGFISSARTAITNPLFGSDVVQLESGDHGGAIVVTETGGVKVCSSYSPMLGRGPGSVPATLQTTPLPPVGLGSGSGVIDVAMGMEGAAALKSDGTVWVWGRNSNHTLDIVGVAPGAIQHVPAQVPLPPGPPVVAIEMDYSVTTHAIRADGSVVVWGANVYNSAGNGLYAYTIIESDDVALGGGEAIEVANSVWNGLAIVRPAQPGSVPARPLHWVSASVGDASIDESDGGTVDVTLSAAVTTPVTVEYDFDGVTGNVVVAAGATSAPIALSVTDDAIDEQDKELPITITAVSNGVRIARHTGLVTVVDDDTPPVVTVADGSVLEGDTSLTDVALTVSLSAPAGADVVVDVEVDGGSAQVGEDVHAYDGSVLVPAGETIASVHLAVNGDALLEDDESFELRLSNPQNAVLADDAATVTIYDDEPIVVSVTAPSVIEGDAGTTPAAFTVTATQPPTPTAVTVAWAVVPGTAEDGTDIVSGQGELVLAGTPGGIEVAVVGDAEDEPLDLETFKLAVGAASAANGRAVVVSDTPVATITDDDDPAVPLVVDAGSDVTSSEGVGVQLTGSVTGADSAGSAWTVADPACAIADPAALVTQITCPDETDTTVTLTLGAVSDTAALHVTNSNPTVGVTAPASGQQFAVGAPVTAAVQLADPGLLDVLNCTLDWGDGSPATACDATHTFTSGGSKTITAAVSDGDGGTASHSVVVTVIASAPAFQFDGFYQPVDNLPVVNSVKAGSTVPLKFGLGGDFGLDIFADGYPASGSKPCAAGAADTLEETAQPGAATLTYDAASGRYHYNWKTLKSWAGQCRTLVLRFADGTEVTAEFRFQ